MAFLTWFLGQRNSDGYSNFEWLCKSNLWTFGEPFFIRLDFSGESAVRTDGMLRQKVSMLIIQERPKPRTGYLVDSWSYQPSKLEGFSMGYCRCQLNFKDVVRIIPYFCTRRKYSSQVKSKACPSMIRAKGQSGKSLLWM